MFFCCMRWLNFHFSQPWKHLCNSRYELPLKIQELFLKIIILKQWRKMKSWQSFRNLKYKGKCTIVGRTVSMLHQRKITIHKSISSIHMGILGVSLISGTGSNFPGFQLLSVTVLVKQQCCTSFSWNFLKVLE